VLQDKSVRCWGGNGSGQAKAPEGSFYGVGAGWLHTCAISASGAVSCFGYDYSGESQPATAFSRVELPDVKGTSDAEPEEEEKPAAKSALASAKDESASEEPADEPEPKKGKGALAAVDKEKASDEGAKAEGKGAAAKRAAEPEIPLKKGGKPAKAEAAKPAAGDSDMSFGLEEAEAAPSEDKSKGKDKGKGVAAADDAQASEKSEKEDARARREEEKKKPRSLDYFLK
jgi:hypothetical protein